MYTKDNKVIRWLLVTAMTLAIPIASGCGGDEGWVAPVDPPAQPQPQPEPPAYTQDPACDDGNPCTEDLRSPDGQCYNRNHTGICNDGNACTYDDRCDGQGSCKGTAISCVDDETVCGAKRRCNGTSQCEVTFPDASNSCGAEGACVTGGHCDGAGACIGGTPLPCESDSCAERECNVTTGKCEVTDQLGQPVYESFDKGWTYSYVKTGSAKLAFRVVGLDLPLYQLVAPGIEEKMLSVHTDEANNCNWCQCASPCTFYNSMQVIRTSKTQLPGTVALRRYVNYSVTHRETIEPIEGWYAEAQDHGYVCAP